MTVGVGRFRQLQADERAELWNADRTKGRETPPAEAAFRLDALVVSLVGEMEADDVIATVRFARVSGSVSRFDAPEPEPHVVTVVLLSTRRQICKARRCFSQRDSPGDLTCAY